MSWRLYNIERSSAVTANPGAEDALAQRLACIKTQLPANPVCFLSKAKLLFSLFRLLDYHLISSTPWTLEHLWTFGTSWLFSMRGPAHDSCLYLLCILFGLLSNTTLAQPYLPLEHVPEGGGDITQPGPCPAYLPAPPGYEFPHLAIPISQTNPDASFSNTYGPYVTAGDMSMVFNFDIPASRQGQTCNIEFLLPNQSQLSTSSFQLSGVNGTYIFSLSTLGSGAVEGNTTFNNQLLQANPHGFPRVVQMQPGHAYLLGSTICVASRFALTMSSPDGSLRWFQDSSECAIGLFITYSP